MSKTKRRLLAAGAAALAALSAVAAHADYPDRAITITVGFAPGGTSDIAPADAFTYLAPKVTFLSNSSGVVTGGARVVINGSGLTGASTVTFGGQEANILAVRHNGTQVVAIAPPGSVGTVGVTVTTPAGSASSARRFTYVVVPPKPPAPAKNTNHSSSATLVSTKK